MPQRSLFGTATGQPEVAESSIAEICRETRHRGYRRGGADGYRPWPHEKLLATASSASSTLSKRLPTKSAWLGFHLSVAQAR